MFNTIGRSAALALGATLAMSGTQTAHAVIEGDPIATGCASGAYAVGAGAIVSYNPTASGATSFGNLHLMYSPTCKTNWAEFDDYPSGYRFLLIAENADGAYQPESWISAGDQSAWTDMVDGNTIPAMVRVCIYYPSGKISSAYLSQTGTPTTHGCVD